MGFLDGGDVAGPGDVQGDVLAAGVGGFDGDAESAQRLQHLDPERAHRDVGPVDERRRRPHDVLGTAPAHIDERVHHAQVGVLPQTEDGEPLVVAGMHVEVVAVVEIPVARGGVRDELGGLVDGIVVPRGQGGRHGVSSRRTRRRTLPRRVRRTGHR